MYVCIESLRREKSNLRGGVVSKTWEGLYSKLEGVMYQRFEGGCLFCRNYGEVWIENLRGWCNENLREGGLNWKLKGVVLNLRKGCNDFNIYLCEVCYCFIIDVICGWDLFWLSCSYGRFFFLFLSSFVWWNG